MESGRRSRRAQLPEVAAATRRFANADQLVELGRAAVRNVPIRRVASKAGAKRQLPFSKQFTPSQIPSLGEFLAMVDRGSASPAGVQAAVHDYLHPHFPVESEQHTMTYNALLSASHYGLLTSDLAGFTDFGAAINGIENDADRLVVFARHIVENLNGAEVVLGLSLLNQAGRRLSKTDLAAFFRDRGLASNADGTDIHAVIGWLASVGVFERSGWYRVNDARFAEIAGIERDAIEQLAGVTASNAAILEQLALQPDYASDSGEMQRLLSGRSDVVIDSPGFVAKHLRPLEQAGLIELEKTTGGRGGSRTRFVGTDRFQEEVVQRLLTRFREVGFGVTGPELQRPIADLVADMTDPDASTDTRGRALELFALRLLHRIGLREIKLRSRPNVAEEIDGSGEGLAPIHTRWQVQCKNAQTLTVDHVAKEVGIAVRNRSTVILLVTTGILSEPARDFARDVVRNSPYTIVELDGHDVQALAANETVVWDLLAREARKAQAVRGNVVMKVVNT